MSRAAETFPRSHRSHEGQLHAAALPEVAREVAAISRDLDRSVDIVVCIPAFQRPEHLRLTLDSVSRQATTRRFAVVIVENDAAERSSVSEAVRFFSDGTVSGLCVIEPLQGNCRAINAAFETARTAFPQASALLMIDDDEIASPDWLELMVRASETTGADIVGGPVLPQFADNLKSHLGRHPAFRPAYDQTGSVPMIYGSGNCLIKRAVFETLAHPSFDLRFNFLGGGDTDFFMRCREAGLRFYWVAEAEIQETVPAARTKAGWLAQRGLRIGAINYHVQWKIAETLWAKTKLAAKMLMLFPFSFITAMRLLMSGQRSITACHPIIVAVGSALASIGIEPQQYKVKK
jgi:glycosyltransferase involved in cell wall biosynthesis